MTKWFERCGYCVFWEGKEWGFCSKHNSQTMYEDWCSLFKVNEHKRVAKVSHRNLERKASKASKGNSIRTGLVSPKHKEENLKTD